MQNILVVGGAGYIGSHTVKRLLEHNLKVTVVDDLSTGCQVSVPPAVKFCKVDILNYDGLSEVFSETRFDGVFHFAAKLSVPESILRPFDYMATNVAGTNNLLKLCDRHGVSKFVFSSTSAVYGEVKIDSVSEDHSLEPKNPYGLSKKMAEELVAQYAAINANFKYQILRYFNVAGAEPDQSNGPRNLNSGQLILNLCKSATGDRKIQIYGQDFGTKDGTAVRDYIHVSDLADAHISAFEKISSTGLSGVWNCGYGNGYTVLEVVQAFEKVNGIKFDIQFVKPREGDPAKVVAANNRIMRESAWKPRYNDIGLICKTTYDWVLNGL